MNSYPYYLSMVATLVASSAVFAENAHHHHQHTEHDERVLHFSHPISTESPTPEKQIRVNYTYESLGGGEPDVQEYEFGAEYRFSSFISVEFGVPYVMQSGGAGDALGNVDVGLKIANPALIEKGILLSYGLEVILPTGDEEKGTGSEDEVELEPFFGGGCQAGDWEWVVFTALGVPVNLPADEESVNELSYSSSLLRFLTPEWRALLEVQGSTVLNGDEEGDTVVNLLPGVTYSPAGGSLWVAFNVGFPVTSEEDYDWTSQTSMIMHF